MGTNSSQRFTSEGVVKQGDKKRYIQSGGGLESC